VIDRDQPPRRDGCHDASEFCSESCSKFD